MKIFGQLKSAILEKLNANPTQVEGRFWYDTVAKMTKFWSDSAVKTVVDTDTAQIMTNKGLVSVSILEPKHDTQANLETYALTATDGQLVFATDTKETYVIKDGELALVGGGGGGSSAIYKIFDLDGSGKLTDWTTVGDTVLSEDKVTQLKGDSSLKYTQVATSVIGDRTTLSYFPVPEQSTRNNTHKLKLRYRLDNANDGDFAINIIGVVATIRKEIQPKNGVYEVTASFPYNSADTNLGLQFKVLNANDGASITVDSIEFSDKFGEYGSITVSETITYTGYDSIDGSDYVKFDTPMTDTTNNLIDHDNNGTYTKYTFKKGSSFIATASLTTSTNSENTTRIVWNNKLGATKKSSTGRAEYYGQTTISDIAEEGDYILVYTGFPSAANDESTNFSVTATATTDQVQFEDSYQQGHGNGVAKWDTGSDHWSRADSTGNFVDLSGANTGAGALTVSGDIIVSDAQKLIVTIPNPRKGTYAYKLTGVIYHATLGYGSMRISDGTNSYGVTQLYLKDSVTNGISTTIEYDGDGSAPLVLTPQVAHTTIDNMKIFNDSSQGGSRTVEISVSYLPPVTQAKTTRILSVNSSLENDFDVDASSTGVLSNFNGADGWCEFDTHSATGSFYYNLDTDQYSVFPIIDPKPVGTSGYTATIYYNTFPSFRVVIKDAGGTPKDGAFQFSAKKRGADRSDRHTPVVNGDDVVFANHKTTEFSTGETWVDGRTIWGRSFEVASDITASGVMTTIDTGLQIMGGRKLSATVWSIPAFPMYALDSSNQAYVLYNSASGEVSVTLQNTSVLTGSSYTIQYVR